MRFDRAQAHHQRGGNFTVHLALGDEHGHLPLALGQPAKPFCGMGFSLGSDLSASWEKSSRWVGS